MQGLCPHKHFSQNAKLSILDMRAPDLWVCPISLLVCVAMPRTMCVSAPSMRMSQCCRFVKIVQVQHHTMRHRTLYPRIVSARGHFFFTSHLTTPMCAWDRRCRPCCSPSCCCPCVLLRSLAGTVQSVIFAHCGGEA